MQRLANCRYAVSSPSPADAIAMDIEGGIGDSTPASAIARAVSLPSKPPVLPCCLRLMAAFIGIVRIGHWSICMSFTILSSWVNRWFVETNIDALQLLFCQDLWLPLRHHRFCVNISCLYIKRERNALGCINILISNVVCQEEVIYTTTHCTMMSDELVAHRRACWHIDEIPKWQRAYDGTSTRYRNDNGGTIAIRTTNESMLIGCIGIAETT